MTLSKSNSLDKTRKLLSRVETTDPTRRRISGRQSTLASAFHTASSASSRTYANPLLLPAVRRRVPFWNSVEDESSSEAPNSFPPIEQPHSAASPPAPGLAGRSVVIVEDEGITLLQLRRTLTQAGLRVLGVAGNGQQGVELVLRERPDIVLMDIRMPQMNGLDAARKILETARVCIIMLTAYSTDEYQQQARDIGTCGYILKPVLSATLLPQVQAAFQKFQQTEEPE